MELLSALEKKIGSLIDLIKELRSEKDRLEQETKSLSEKVTLLENSLLEKDKNVQAEWEKERASTRKVVDELISDIDSLMEGEGR